MGVKIPLQGINGSNKYTLVSDEDADLAEHRWNRVYPYACRSENGQFIQLHRVVFERMFGESLIRTQKVIHINGNKLDNRRENLQCPIYKPIQTQKALVGYYSSYREAMEIYANIAGIDVSKNA